MSSTDDRHSDDQRENALAAAWTKNHPPTSGDDLAEAKSRAADYWGYPDNRAGRRAAERAARKQKGASQ